MCSYNALANVRDEQAERIMFIKVARNFHLAFLNTRIRRRSQGMQIIKLMQARAWKRENARKPLEFQVDIPLRYLQLSRHSHTERPIRTYQQKSMSSNAIIEFFGISLSIEPKAFDLFLLLSI